MKFINIGCWNKGTCNLDYTIDNSSTDAVSVVLNNIKSFVESNSIDFMVVTGDNYYPTKPDDINKVHNYNDFKSGFDCLESIPIRKYILFGNHEYNDIYNSSAYLINNPYFTIPVLEPIKCANLRSQQQLLAENPDFILFDNVLHVYDESQKTLLIMIDTTIYEDKIEIECYQHIFSDVVDKTIDNIRGYQLDRVNTLLEDYNEATDIIITGHHPIIFCKTKKDKKMIIETTELINFFNNLSNLASKKIVYICADTHFYQKGIVTLTGTGLVIEQHIVGTGGAKCDNICNSDSKDITLTNINYKLDLEINEYGYLIYNNGILTFNIVPFDIKGKKCYKGDTSSMVHYTRKYAIIYN
jgi:hypothetical protein